MIKLKDVSLTYGKMPILQGLNHSFSPKDFTCIIGRNGSGKSTLVRAASGISSYKGSILLDGKQISLLPHKERAKRISYLPQNRPIPAMDVKTLIAHGRYPHLGFSKTLAEKDKERIEYAARVTGVEGLLTRHLSALSGGERQRAYIAMLLVQDAQIMLLDEPTTYLDITHQLEVMEILKKLHESGKGVVMAVHDLPLAFSYATNVVLISGGGIAAAGKTGDVASCPRLEAALGVTVRGVAGADEVYSYRIARGSKKVRSGAELKSAVWRA